MASNFLLLIGFSPLLSVCVVFMLLLLLLFALCCCCFCVSVKVEQYKTIIKLNDVRASSGPHTLLHFIAEIVARDFPAYNGFYNELLSLQAASTSLLPIFNRTDSLFEIDRSNPNQTLFLVSIQSLNSEIQELVNGLQIIESECKLNKSNKRLEVIIIRILLISEYETKHK